MTRGTDKTPPRMFETRSESWQEAGLAHQIVPRAARRAVLEVLALAVVFAGVITAYLMRHALFGVGGETCGAQHGGRCAANPSDTPVRIVAVALLLVLGGAFARYAGRALSPWLFRRMEPATAGTVGFLIRLVTVAVVVLVALVVAGLEAKEALAYGGAFTAIVSVIVGLAAQQTLGNFFAGTVLLSARPFRVGERVRLQGGMLAGQVEGVVSSLGLLYTTFATGEDSIMVPNSVVLSVAVRPLREPDAVSLRAKLAPGVTPADLQSELEGSLQTPLRGSPRITLAELEDGQAVVQIRATPRRAADGRNLAGELLRVVSRQTTAQEPVDELAGAPPGGARRPAQAPEPADGEAGADTRPSTPPAPAPAPARRRSGS